MEQFDQNLETIVLGGGCFWCTEAIFKSVNGVKNVESGYSGGKVPNPTYEQICSGNTGHAEVIKVELDPTIVSLRNILVIFFASHDPTTMNRQGNDVGPQYRSVIFYSNNKQKEEAEKIIGEIENSSSSGGKVVTEVKVLENYYPAENYHRDYFKRNPDKAYCQIIINPKLEKVQKEYAELFGNSK